MSIVPILGRWIVKKQDILTFLSPLRNGTDPERRADRSGLRKYVSAALVLVFGLTVAVAVYRTVRQNEQLRYERDFESLVGQSARIVHHTINGYMQSVLAVQALFEASEFVSREEFSRFVEPMLEKQSGIRAFGWIPRVRKSEEAAYRKAARADGFEFRITPIRNGSPPEEGTLADAYPVFYLEPHESNEPAFGIDLGSEFVRADAIARARDTAKPQMTEPIELVQAAGATNSTIIFAPQYSGDSAGKDLEWRRQHLSGFVNVVVDLSYILIDSRADFPSRFVDVSLYYEEDLLAGRDLDSEVLRTQRSPSKASFGRTENIGLGGRLWRLRFEPTPLFRSSLNTTRPILALLAGLALTLLGTAYLYISMRSSEIAGALAQSELRYRALVENAPEAILTIDVGQERFTDANPKACELFGYSREDLLRHWLTDISPPVQPDGRLTPVVAEQYLRQALEGETPTFVWVHRDRKGRVFPCEVRLVRLPGSEGTVVRGSISDITERVRSEERQALMTRELDHRVKNNLATVLALTEQSAAGADSADELRDSLVGRIRAIASLYSALASKQWSDMGLSEVCELTFAPYNRRAEIDRIHCSGPPCTVSPDTASAICMVGHELATNAVKYGALSKPDGRVDMTWALRPEGVAIEWAESGGPEIGEPDRTGYGTRLIKGIVEHQLGGRVEAVYLPSGLHCRIYIPANLAEASVYRI